MNLSKKFLSILPIFICYTLLEVQAQNLINGFSVGKGNFNFSSSYTYETFDELIVEDEVRDISTTLGEFDVNSISLYGEYGITDRLDVIATLPYIITIADNGMREIREEGFQDMSLFLKYAFYRRDTENTSLNVVGAVGYSFPVSDYDPTTSVNIGTHTNNARLALAGINRWKSGFFAEISSEYAIRNEGAPNLLSGHAKVGWLNDKFYTHVWYQFSECFNGSVLGQPERNYQDLNTDAQRIGVLVAYKVIPRLSVFTGAGTFLNGENIANTKYFVNVGISTSLYFLQGV
ncbi:MAG: transporter [Bacteroidota bacterium]